MVDFSVSSKQANCSATVIVGIAPERLKMIKQVTIRVIGKTFGYAVFVKNLAKRESISNPRGSVNFTVSTDHSPLKANLKESTVEYECRGGKEFNPVIGTTIIFRQTNSRDILIGNAGTVRFCDKEYHLKPRGSSG